MSVCKPGAGVESILAGAPAALARALERLTSLHEGDQAVAEVVVFGSWAIPELRELLFRREPSGLYQPRRRVVDALAAIGADDVLLEFLAATHDVADPVENAGEEVVLSATARALRGTYSEAVFALLLSLAENRRLPGAIEALARFQRAEALPCIVASLSDDLARPSAEAAIAQFGELAWPHLLQTLGERVVQEGSKTESSRRRRRAALELLIGTRGSVTVSAGLRRQLAMDDDPAISVLGCALAMRCGDPGERAVAAGRLLDLLPCVHWAQRQRIEECLIAHPDGSKPLVAARRPRLAPALTDFSPEAEAQRSVLRIAARLGL